MPAYLPCKKNFESLLNVEIRAKTSEFLCEICKHGSMETW